MYQSGDPKAEAEGESSKSIERIYWKIWIDNLAFKPYQERQVKVQNTQWGSPPLYSFQKKVQNIFCPFCQAQYEYSLH